MASFTVVPMDAADTETQSDVPAVAPEPKTTQKRKVIAGAVASAVLLAAGAAVAATKSGTAAQWTGAEGAVSQATFPGHGCANWDTAMIESLKSDSRAGCEAKCAATPGCQYANYQPGQCRDGVEGAAPGTCHLNAECKKEENHCWDLSEVSGPAVWTKKPDMGCGNWNAIKLGQETTKTLWQCYEACEKNADCTAFNYQHDDCTGSEHIGKGACYLFKNSCTEESNACWDLYHVRARVATTTTTTSTTNP